MSERSEALEAADGSVSMRLRNLTAGTTYYYMLQGGNGTAVLSGETLNFTTLPNLQPTIGDVKVLSSSPMSVIVIALLTTAATRSPKAVAAYRVRMEPR